MHDKQMTRTDRAIQWLLDDLRRHAPTRGCPRVKLTGSTYYVERADSDVDVLVLCDGLSYTGLLETVAGLTACGWVPGGSHSPHYTDKWVSMTHPDTPTNALLVGDRDLWNRWCAASEACRTVAVVLGTISKEQVVAIHNTVMGEEPATLAAAPAPCGVCPHRAKTTP